MKKIPVSVFIITKNERDRIAKPINSVIDWVEEVIVVDSGSDDGTQELAKNLGARVVFNEWHGYGPQKIFGETLCKNKWLLNIDADEEITPELAEEIRSIFYNKSPEFHAYRMKIQIMSRFAERPFKCAPYHNQIRLYQIDHAGFKSSTVHDSVVAKEGIECKIAQLKNIVLHRSFRSYEHAIAKINRYSGMQAEDMVLRGKKPCGFRIVFEPFIGFWKGYFVRRYCFMGVDGFIEAFIYAFARTLRLMKARELLKEEEFKRIKNN